LLSIGSKRHEFGTALVLAAVHALGREAVLEIVLEDDE
jgi:hypothetical protein